MKAVIADINKNLKFKKPKKLAICHIIHGTTMHISCEEGITTYHPKFLSIPTAENDSLAWLP